jgi:hypothetical protein
MVWFQWRRFPVAIFYVHANNMGVMESPMGGGRESVNVDVFISSSSSSTPSLTFPLIVNPTLTDTPMPKMSRQPTGLPSNLMKACETGDVEIVRHYLKKKPSTQINKRWSTQECDYGTALTFASEKGYLGIVRVLMSHPHINPNVADYGTDQTALHLACYYGHLPIVKVLMAYPGIVLNAVDKYGDTPFILACERDSYPELVDFMLSDPRIDINHVNNDGLTALTTCARNGSVKPVHQIISTERHLDTSDVLQQAQEGLCECDDEPGKAEFHLLIQLLERFLGNTHAQLPTADGS